MSADRATERATERDHEWDRTFIALVKAVSDTYRDDEADATIIGSAVAALHRHICDQADHAETLDALNQATRERDEAQAEVERLHSWGGLLELLDEHWPADIFIVPDTPDDAMHTGRHRDTGPIILGLIRWVDRLKSEHAVLDRVRAAIGEHRTSQGPAATVPVWALERAIDGGEGDE